MTQSVEGYEDAISRFAANARRRAKIVAFVRNATDVARAIAYAQSEKLPLAVRGGGYSVAAVSSVEDGLVVDLSRYLNTVEVSKEDRLSFVGGGALWGTVDEKAIKHGLATVGGMVNFVSMPVLFFL